MSLVKGINLLKKCHCSVSAPPLDQMQQLILERQCVFHHGCCQHLLLLHFSYHYISLYLRSKKSSWFLPPPHPTFLSFSSPVLVWAILWLRCVLWNLILFILFLNKKNIWYNCISICRNMPQFAGKLSLAKHNANACQLIIIFKKNYWCVILLYMYFLFKK